MRIVIDAGLCQGHARCASLVPDVFDLDDDGFAIVLSGREHVAEDDVDALLAIDNCPEQAIRLERDA